MNPKLYPRKLGSLGLYLMKNKPGKRGEFSVEMLSNWFDWRINFFGKDFTVWLEFD